MSIAEGMLAEFEHESGLTRGKLARVPDDKLSYKPHEKSMSMDELMTHIAESLGMGAAILEQTAFDLNMEEHAPHGSGSVSKVLEIFDGGAAAVKDALQGKSDEHMMVAWTLNVNGEKVFEMPRVAAIRAMLMNHMIHHRGQLGVYMRLNDLPLPAIYGPSADESGM